MSSNQKRIYTLEQSQDSSVTYNMPIILKLEDTLDYARLDQAFNQLCERHEAFRTSFSIEKDKFIQRIHLPQKNQIEGIEGNTSKEMIKRFVRPFDLSQAPLIRMGLGKDQDGCTFLFIDVHHIISDGASTGILLEELSELYNGNHLEPVELHYKDFSAWQNSLALDDQEQFWQEELRPQLPETDLPVDFKMHEKQSFEGNHVETKIDGSIKEKIELLNRQNQTTSFMVYLTTLMIFLTKLNRQDRVVIGTAAEGRSHPSAEAMIGMFVNTLPIIGTIDPQKNFIDLLEAVKNKSLDVFENQDYPYEKIAELGTKSPIFDVMFSYEVGYDETVYIGGQLAKVEQIQMEVSKFDLTVTLIEHATDYTINWEYNSRLFKEETVQRLAAYFEVLLGNLLTQTSQPVSEVQYLKPSQITQIKEEFNQPNNQMKQAAFISPIQCFEEQVLKNPDKPAVYYQEEQLTYSQLNVRANAVAQQLKQEQIGKNDVVALIVEQSAELVIGILGILKAGAAYLPITPTTPIERINYILEDSQAKGVLCSLKEKTVSEKLSCKGIFIHTESCQKEAVERQQVEGADLAYIIYTSGSTGKPKGVMIENHSLMNLIEWQSGEGKVSEQSIVLQKAIYTFDASVWEIFLALLSGATLQMLSAGEHDDLGKLLDVFEKNRITHFLMVPTFLEALLNYTKENQREKAFETIEAVYVGAEKVTNHLLNQFVDITGKELSVVRNLYGPTEGTVCATYYQYPNHLDSQDTLIGKAIHQVQVYIMNDQTYCGIGIPGEIYIGGAGVARGYLNQPELTAKQFVILDGQVVYKTGDLGKYRVDGSIDYLGRMDNQVKIRGFRVELTEIRQTLLQMPEIISAAVTVKKQKGTDYLCAYLVADSTLAENDVKSYLSRSLPDYMIPNFFSFLDKLPITANGKLAEKQLPEPDTSRAKLFLAPKTEKERQVVTVLKEILQLEQVNLLDSFYELGGDSIKAIRIVSKVREHDYQLTVKEIMQAGSIKEMIQKMNVATQKMNQEMVTGLVTKSPVQQFFYSSNLNTPEHFNQSLILEINGLIDEERLKKAMDELTLHHDMLRMGVKHGEQIISSWEQEKNYDFHSFSLSEDSSNVMKEIQTIGAPFQSMFTFDQSPLLRILVFQSKQTSYLWVQMHHLIVDAVSWQIFIEDLNQSYECLINGQPSQLPQKTTSYPAWSEGVKELTKQYEIKKDEAYWQEVNQEIASTSLFDQTIPTTQSHTFTFELDVEETKKLRFKANKAFSTEISDLLLTALAKSLGNTFGKGTISFTLEGHGRELFDSVGSIDRTIGWFTSMYPLMITLEGSLAETIKQVKESIRKIPNKGMSYSLLTTYSDKLVNQKTDVVFNYLGELGDSKQKEGAQLFTISNSANVNDCAEANTIGSPLSVNCYIQNDRLITDLVYAAPILSSETIAAISDSYQKELVTIVDYCQNIVEPQKTASDLGEFSWSQAEFDLAQQRADELFSGEIQKIIPLTSMQEGLLYHKLLDENATSYVIQCSYDVNTKMDQERLDQSLSILAEKHPALKTNILYKDIKEPRQVIFSDRILETSSCDFSKAENAEEQFIQYKMADVRRGFDLERESLFRVTLVEMPAGQRLIFTFHHIIMDGWCLSIVLNDWMKIYTALQTNEEAVAWVHTEIDTIYEDYARTVAELDKEASLDYWERLLEEYETQASFIGMYPKNDQKAEVKAIFDSLSTEETHTIQTIAKENKITMNTVVETIWGLILQRYNHTNDAVFGKMVSGRNLQLSGIEEAVGLFINAIPVRVKNGEKDTFVDVAKEIQNQSIESEEHTYCSLSEIQNRTRLGKELIHTIIVFENYTVQETDEAIRVLGEMEDYREQTSYPISLSVGAGDELSFKLMFDERLFTETEAQLILSRIIFGLKELARNPALTCGDFSFVSEDEQNQVMTMFNPKKQDNSSYPTIVAALKAQAQKQPNKVAVIFEEEQLTYAQLEEKSTILAKRILAFGKQDGAFIGLYCDRTIEMVIGIYGIMKAGAAYIPLAPTLPEERIRYVLADSEIQLVLNGQTEKAVSLEATVIDYTVEDLQENESPTIDLPVLTAADNAYVIYTSGTTGNPKGVIVGHASLMNLVNWQKRYFSLDSEQTILQQFSFIFDGSVFELFAGCLVGGTLEIISDEVKNNPDCFLKKLKQKILITVPSLFKMLLEYAEENNRQDEIKQLSKVGLAGEATTMALVEKFYRVMTDSKTTLYNLYGPTETTVCASAYEVVNQRYKSVPIGSAIDNSKLFVFHQEQLCGIGMLGELCISGDNLALAYLNKPETTAEKFVQNPIIPSEKMYRTGDLVKWQEDGNIQYVGRIDEQVKIRGFRIELGEIENQLGLIPTVWDACVITRTVNNEVALCAYLVANEDITAFEVKEQLKKTLPDYMIPGYITIMDKLPVTKAGKIDKRNLPEPQRNPSVSYEAPRNELEVTICGLFEEILEIERVGIDDDFFELGGHSLKAVHLANGISKVSGVKVPLSDILQEKNVRSIAEKVKELTSAGSLVLDSIEIVDDEEL